MGALNANEEAKVTIITNAILDCEDSKRKRLLDAMLLLINHVTRVPAPQRTKFIPPTLPEVAAYCELRGKGVSAEHWYDHYTSNGWKVGRNPMKDWRAAVRTWEWSAAGLRAPLPSLPKGITKPEAKSDPEFDAWFGDMYAKANQPNEQ